MQGIFERWDRFANGILFSGYRLIRPSTILSISVAASFWAYSSIRYRSSQLALCAQGVDGLLIMALAFAGATGNDSSPLPSACAAPSVDQFRTEFIGTNPWGIAPRICVASDGGPTG